MSVKTIRDAMNLYEALTSIGNVFGSAKWNYAVALNKRRLADVVEAVNEANRNLPPEGQAYEEAKSELGRQYAEKDPRGQPLILPGGMMKLRDPGGFRQALAALQDQNPVGVKQSKAREEEVEKLMGEPVREMRLIVVPPDVAPDLPASVFEALLPMIEEPAE
jgi:hypothetical protein